MRSSVILLTATLLAASTTICRGQSSTTKKTALPDSAQSTVKKLLELGMLEYRTGGEDGNDQFSERASAHSRFLDLLEKLDEQVDEPSFRKLSDTKPIEIDFCLLSIARDYANHADRFNALIDVYGSPPKNSRLQVIHPKPPQPEHLTEDFRTAWELLLLAPTNDESRFMRQTCFTAISSLKNDASIPVLLYIFERANVEVQAGRQWAAVWDDEIRVISALARNPNSNSLHAAMKCREMSFDVGEPLPKAHTLTIPEWIMHCLSYQDRRGRGNREKWAPIIEGALAKDVNLSKDDRLFLRNFPKMSDSK